MSSQALPFSSNKWRWLAATTRVDHRMVRIREPCLGAPWFTGFRSVARRGRYFRDR